MKSENTSTINISVSNNNLKILKKNMKYFSVYYKQILEIVLQFINTEDDDADHSEWTLARASEYLLQILVQVIDSEVMDNIINYIETNLNAEDLKLKNTVLKFFACSIDTSHKVKMLDLILKHMKSDILKLLSHQNKTIKLSTSLLLVKITKHFSKSFDLSLLNILIPALQNSLIHANRIAINICQSLIHITKAVGDLETNKNQSKPLNKTISL
jgi:hypothetical protein